MSYRREENHEVTLKFDSSEEMQKAVRALAMVGYKFEISWVKEWDYIVVEDSDEQSRKSKGDAVSLCEWP